MNKNNKKVLHYNKKQYIINKNKAVKSTIKAEK
jgi:hypothetical protein